MWTAAFHCWFAVLVTARFERDYRALPKGQPSPIFLGHIHEEQQAALAIQRFIVDAMLAEARAVLLREPAIAAERLSLAPQGDVHFRAPGYESEGSCSCGRVPSSG
jgi:hypothetical protein